MKKITVSRSEKKLLQWIYERLVNIHKENPNADYMIHLKGFIDSTQPEYERT